MADPNETRAGQGKEQTKVLFWVLFLRQSQLASPNYRLCPPPDLELPEDAQVVPLDGAQGDEKPVRDLLVREPISQKAQDLDLPLAVQGKRLGIGIEHHLLADGMVCQPRMRGEREGCRKQVPVRVRELHASPEQWMAGLLLGQSVG